MTFNSLLELSVLFTLVFYCNTLHIHRDDKSLKPEERALTTSSSQSQDVAITLPANFSIDSPGTGLQVSCDTIYGFALDESSCQNVLSYCYPRQKMESWAYPEDVPPGQSVDEELPIKLFSGECAQDQVYPACALCGFVFLI